MLAQPTKDEGVVSERPSETQPTPSPPHPSTDQHETQPDPSLRSSPTIPIPDSIPVGFGGNHGGQSSSDRSLSGNEDGLTLQKGLHEEKIGKEEVLEEKVDVEGVCKKSTMKKKIESDAESEGVDEAERKFDQLAKDEEIARKVQEDYEVEEEMKKLAEEEATKAALIQDFDDIHARIEADRLLAARLQEEERETFTVEERAKFLYDTIAAQRRFLAQQRAVAIRSRPPTRTQQRNQMMTYLKHVRRKKHADLKNKNFKEIQVLYKEVKRSDKNFIAIGSTEDERQIKEMNEESKDPKRKRLKKRVVNETPREEDTTKLHNVSSPDGDYLVVYRVNGHFRAFNYLMEGDLKIMMESSTEENDQGDFWNNQQDGSCLED
ncbi:hypothetical protein Tco_1341548 [Tanacetum coccineum]